MTARLSSGHRRLDQILHGGLPGNAINLLIGAPGSGKTILSQQYVFHNATAERPALYLSTVSEPFDKIIRFGQGLDFFDPGAVGERVVYEDVGGTLYSEGLPGVLACIDRLLKRHRPGLVVIDSFRALHAFAPDESAFRRFLHDLAGRLTALAGSTFWVGEYEPGRGDHAAEFAVADAIIALTTRTIGVREARMLRVLKLRGSGFASGEHAYRITGAGLDVFPRLADVGHEDLYTLGSDRVSTGVAALDELLGDGYWPGASTLVVGPSGVGKTLLGLHFVFSGGSVGEPGIFAGFQEHATQLGRIVQGFGWSLPAEGVHLMTGSPVDVYIDQWVYELLDMVERMGARRVVIDSLTDLLTSAGDPQRFREWVHSLTQRCSRAGVSLVMTLETPDLFQVSRVSEVGMSHLSDNVLLLHYVREAARLRRALTVLKTRASGLQPAVRGYDITSRGIVLQELL